MSTLTVDSPLLERALAAVATVDDPEIPGVSIVDLGLLETITTTDEGHISIGLIPTFSGCPALAMIASDVEAAVAALPGVEAVTVSWLTAPVWDIERVTSEARTTMATDLTVAVRIGTGPTPCPRCGSPTVEQSEFGPSRCRAVHRCESCREVVEVMRDR
ncbi:MAG: phenylacetate-CoA oxygenase subunit PaaJ [Acidimicrobiia bacterium]|nr:phenylacetate-CoA oxygenase subunit PaaJ [Actinomycetota bacterium]MBL6924158.1 phenylacetate-CoA oxygenase subunit PaaJ [Acidimicrobiia bacterium]MBL6926892.1 phenylacetate-CoA oxygenase subunit PaaJ [Acidimicrobiia bacterium]